MRFNVTSKAGLCVCCAVISMAMPACVSAPIDLAGSATSDETAISTQTELRQSAIALASYIDEAGWSLGDDAGEATRSFLGRLIGGDNGQVSNSNSAVDNYIAERVSAPQMVADLTGLVDETQSVSVQALRVASTDSVLNLEGLDRDIAMTERALGAVRRAAAFFKEVYVRASLSESEENELNEQITALKTAESHLAISADALAERRWAIRQGAIG